jgi:hypothetical protein
MVCNTPKLWMCSCIRIDYRVLGHLKWACKADSLLLTTSLAREFNRLGRNSNRFRSLKLIIFVFVCNFRDVREDKSS